MCHDDVGRGQDLLLRYPWLDVDVGWQHAESTLRVLARTVPLEGFGKPKDQVMKSQPYAANLERVQQSLDRLPADWAAGGANPGVTRELLTLIREGRPVAAGERAARHLVDGKARAGAVWDAVHLAGALGWSGAPSRHVST